MSEIKEVFEENGITDEQMLKYVNEALKLLPQVVKAIR